jgi:hypothetical protein
MNAELRKARDRQLKHRTEAISAVYESLKAHFTDAYKIVDWSRAIEEKYSAQWGGCERHPDGGWNWPEIRRRFNAPRDQVVAVLCGDRLSALSLVKSNHTWVEVAFLEGDPRADCPLKAKRAVIVLEFAAMYGQSLGVNELRLHPVNSSLEDLYVKGYGFKKVGPPKDKPYLKRAI